MNEYDELQVSQMFGIPLEWFKEVDAACDAWLKRHGLKTQSVSGKWASVWRAV